VRARLWAPLVAVLAVGLAVRVLALASYATAALWGDSLRFARIAPWAPLTGMFDDPWMPAGYPLFLRAIQQVTRQLWVTVAIQHLIGLCTALLLYGLVRRLGAPRGVALVPAAVVALSGDYVYMEHALLNEFLTIAAIVAGLYLVVRAEGSARQLRWLIGAGAMLGLAAVVRNIALVVLAATVLWVLLAPPRPAAFAVRLRGAACLALAAVVVVGGYAALATGVGRYAGISDLRGWFLYGRAAPFARCAAFSPTGELARLCERTPPDQRSGPFHYVNDTTGPGRRHFDLLPWACALDRPGRRCNGSDQAKVGAFAREAILHQPLAYAKAVTKDLARFVDPDFGARRPWWGSGPLENSFRFRDPGTQRVLAAALRQRYDGVRIQSGAGRTLLESYQAVFRLDGLLVLVALACAVAGVTAGRGPGRRGAALLLGAAALLYLAPVASFSYDYRYGMVPQPLLVAAAALGGWALAARRREPGALRDSQRPAAPPSPTRRQTTAPRTAASPQR
jgi:hypothetical protein